MPLNTAAGMDLYGRCLGHSDHVRIWILDYLFRGTLLDKLNRMQSLSEVKSAGYIRTLLDVVQHMHSLNVVHQVL